MIKNKNIREVEEDIVIGRGNQKITVRCLGVNKFEFPLTVSFTSEGVYRVEISGNKAEVEPVHIAKVVHNPTYDRYECPRCGCIVNKYSRFCEHCAQELNWRFIQSNDRGVNME